MSLKDTAVRYIIDELLMNDPEYIDFIEWLEDNEIGEQYEEDVWDTDIYDEVVLQLATLRELAQDNL